MAQTRTRVLKDASEVWRNPDVPPSAEISNMTVLDQMPIRNPGTTRGHRRHDKLHDRLTHSRGISVRGLIADGNNTGTSLIEYFQSFTEDESK